MTTDQRVFKKRTRECIECNKIIKTAEIEVEFYNELLRRND